MSILCCRVPDFLVTLSCGATLNPEASSLALLGPDERVCALSAPARQAGVRLQMTPRQAQTRCPNLLIRPLDMEICQAQQAAFIHTLSRWQLPVEILTWGMAYVDLQSLAATPDDAQQLATEMGRNLRQTLGQSLQPALGWDSGKFTARAAAGITPPGRMRLVDKAQERPFLAPLAIHFLPLPGHILRELHWLGIRTLGQFAALPASAVWQRFGKTGRAAQRWAMGRDDRPVGNQLQMDMEPVEIELDPPTGQVQYALDALMAKLLPFLQALAERMEGCRGLYLEIRFANGETRLLHLVWIEPSSRPEQIRTLLHAQLTTLNWPAEAQSITLLRVESAELPAMQMTLFVENVDPLVNSDAILPRLIDKYGPIFFGGELPDPQHPVDARRIQLATLA